MKEVLDSSEHAYLNTEGGGRGKSQRTNKHDEDPTRPAAHSQSLCGTKNTMTNPTQSATHISPIYRNT